MGKYSIKLISYSAKQIASIIAPKAVLAHSELSVSEILSDSRRLVNAASTLFFALKGKNDGHKFIAELYQLGVRNFVISTELNQAAYPEANFFNVENPLKALQQLAGCHRSQFTYPVIGITGSNGKTIIKEWLYQLLSVDKHIVRSPKSYNSQIGVPLSLWNMSAEHQLAIIEAGISEPNEMGKLEQIIQPDMVLLSHMGAAHDENFKDQSHKVSEKLQLATHAKTLIYCKEDIPNELKLPAVQLFSWSFKEQADLLIKTVHTGANQTWLEGLYKGLTIEITIPFTDAASIENAIYCWSLMLFLDYKPEIIAERMLHLAPLSMRLELKHGINNCMFINDSYSSDIDSLQIALDFLNQQQGMNKTVILSDLLQTGIEEKELYTGLAKLLKAKGVHRFIGVGQALSRNREAFSMSSDFYPDTASLLNAFKDLKFNQETLLIKGARTFEFEKVCRLFELKVHDTVLEINLNAIVNNLNYYRSKVTAISPKAKLMAMVKAFSYGSGSVEIANLLQFHKVDYLAVAYIDEGVVLRKAGINTRIMVMNPELSGFDLMLEHCLEPEVYSMRELNLLVNVLEQKKINQYPIHIKLETGMKRLGFEENELPVLIDLLKVNKHLRVQSVFSHLAGSDEAIHDGFTQEQINRFERMSRLIIKSFNYEIMRHISNTAAITRFPDAAFDMVRLGIGLYGVDSGGASLQTVGTLKTSISQIKSLAPGESIGYSRKAIAKEEMKTATIMIGYADGLNRALSNGKGYMMLNGKKAPILGNICMDMCMLDITGIDAKEGDEVIVFGDEPTISQLATSINTIPYELLTMISQRVKRVYYYE